MPYRYHGPEDEAALEPLTQARQRLAYDELLSNQLALALVRLSMRRVKGREIEGDGRLRQKVIDALPFQLTGSQETAMAEIAADMAQPLRMLTVARHGDAHRGDPPAGVVLRTKLVGGGRSGRGRLAVEVDCGAHAIVVRVGPCGHPVLLESQSP